jgi:hypothetical protein
VEALRESLGGLLRERERLAYLGEREALESNRLEIVRTQHELARAFGERYGSRSDEPGRAVA